MTYFVLRRGASRLHLCLLQQFELTKPTYGRLISLSIWDCYLSILCCNWIVGLYSASAHPPIHFQYWDEHLDKRMQSP
jgi:hypothetical protein